MVNYLFSLFWSYHIAWQSCKEVKGMFFLIGMQGFSKDSFPKECCVIPYRKNVPGRTVRTCEWKEWRSLKQTSSPCAEMGSELIHFSKDVLTTIPLAVLICSRLSNWWLLLHSWHRRSSCIFRYAKHNEVWRCRICSFSAHEPLPPQDRHSCHSLGFTACSI